MDLKTIATHHSSSSPALEAIAKIETLLLPQSDVEEVLLSDGGSFCVRRNGALEILDSCMFCIDVATIIRHLAQTQSRRIDPMNPSCGGQLGESKHRWHALIPPAVDGHPILSIRRNQMASLDLDSFEWSDDSREVLAQVIAERCPIVVCGPAGSGKTSLLAGILALHCSERRLLLIEQYPEIRIASPFWTRLLEKPPDLDRRGQIGFDFLVRESLRLRPDALVFGEIRGAEANALVRAAVSGHQVFATLHAGGRSPAISRLRSLVNHELIEVLDDISIHFIHVIRTGDKFQIIL